MYFFPLVDAQKAITILVGYYFPLVEIMEVIDILTLEELQKIVSFLYSDEGHEMLALLYVGEGKMCQNWSHRRRLDGRLKFINNLNIEVVQF